LCSLAVERGAAGLVAGPRGAGKTTALGALLWELPAATRAVVVEETPELPTDALGDAGRDVQPLRVGTDDDDALSPTEAVRAALRLGEGSLVVGEVRGEEARALYEAMRVGAAADAVLGTIHGTDAASVRERVVSDLGVSESSFAATDFVLTLGPDRRLDGFEEVVTAGGGSDTTGDDTRFAPLFDRGDASGRGDDAGAATPTGRVDRGESALVAGLARPSESYADVRTALETRAERFRDLAADGRVGVDAAGVTSASAADAHPTARGDREC
ncbi:ATPase, T2SS/T4P/T4SS family, partial [Candidatus Halobonum tyrrellensis]